MERAPYISAHFLEIKTNKQIERSKCDGIRHNVHTRMCRPVHIQQPAKHFSSPTGGNVSNFLGRAREGLRHFHIETGKWHIRFWLECEHIPASPAHKRIAMLKSENLFMQIHIYIFDTYLQKRIFPIAFGFALGGRLYSSFLSVRIVANGISMPAT